MEAFNVLQQSSLDAFARNEITIDHLIEEYAKSEEGFDLHHFLPLLTLAREGGVQVRAGFPPRPAAKKAVGGSREVWDEAKGKGWLQEWNEGSPAHFQWFKSLFQAGEWCPPPSFNIHILFLFFLFCFVLISFLF